MQSTCNRMMPVTAFASLVLLIGLSLLCVPAQAQDAPAPATDEGRYTFHRVQDTFVRLDNRTGQVSTCAYGASGWTCQAVPDERTALESEIGRLQNDNAALKKELLARGAPLPGGSKPEPPVARAPEKTPDRDLKMPSDEELAKVKSFLGDVWRRLVEMIASLQREIQRKS
jgi:hypothetical protein